jgi:hypothetical protein
MALQTAGANGTVVQANVEHLALRTEVRPFDTAGGGQYAYGGFTGVLPAALGANSEIFQFRWTDVTRLCVVRKIRISAAVSTTFFAAGVPIQIDLVKATAWTVQGTLGTGITPAALLKKRTSMPNTLLATGDARIATTAALGAGTKTLEGLSLAAILASAPITASLYGQIIAPGTILFQNEVGDGEHPLILAQNEGFVIRSVAVPATGTWTASIEVQWAEVAAY